MKKFVSLLLIAMLMVGSLSGCGSKAADSDKLQIVTTIYPEYDWVMEILGDKASDAEVTLLLDDGVDLHSYQPTAEDILKISTCDVFIYVGGESDEWVEDALQEATNKDMIVINLMESLGDSAKEEEVVEGMEGHDHDEDAEEHDHDEDATEDEAEHEHDEDAEEEHDHDEDAEEHEHEEGEEHEHEEGEEHEHEHEEGEVEYDEHVWLSLKNAAALTQVISDAIQKADSANADAYKSNTEAYIAKLNELDEAYAEAVSEASTNTVLFGDRFPFRYMVDDYNLDYYAAFVGCSSETEASFETITFLAGKVDELSLNAVLTIETSDQSIAKTIVENTESKDQKILTLDSMQSTTADDIKDGVTYLSIMESNLEVLKEALN